jgi:YfiH family protein
MHFQIRECQGVEAVECVPLRQAGIVAAFSRRQGGVSALPQAALNLGHFSGDPASNVQENRRRFLQTLQLPQSPAYYPLLTLRQVHSADVCYVTDPQQHQPVAADALVTASAQTFAAVLTADCVPILIADLRQGVVAAVHAGWRGTVAAIVIATLHQMQAHHQTHPTDCLVAIGPAIGACCFRVGPEVVARFEQQFPDAPQLFSQPETSGHCHIDLRAANQQQLTTAGVPAAQIFTLTDCTVCQVDRYFSYRREQSSGAVGRLMSVIARLN